MPLFIYSSLCTVHPFQYYRILLYSGHYIHTLSNISYIIWYEMDWANLALYRDVWRGWSAGAEFRTVIYFIASFPFLAFEVGLRF